MHAPLNEIDIEYPPEKICSECSERPVQVKIWGLCFRCYQAYRRSSNGIKVRDHGQGWYRRSYLKKYGPAFLEDMTELKTNYSLTLKILGEKYGCTRENIRQAFKRIFGTSYTAYHKKKAAKYHKAMAEIACTNDPRHKVAEYSGGTVLKGAKSELAVAKKCRELGFSVETPCGTNVDLIVNGYNVEVKMASKSIKTTIGNRSKYFHFKTNPKQYSESDFYVCHVPIKSTFYVIPKYSASPNGFYIRDGNIRHRTDYQPKSVDYDKFRDAWDLLTFPPSKIVPICKGFSKKQTKEEEKKKKHEYYIKNKEREKERRRKRYIEKKEKIKEQSRQYYQKNRDRILANAKRRYDNDKAKSIQASRKH